MLKIELPKHKCNRQKIAVIQSLIVMFCDILVFPMLSTWHNLSFICLSKYTNFSTIYLQICYEAAFIYKKNFVHIGDPGTGGCEWVFTERLQGRNSCYLPAILLFKKKNNWCDRNSAVFNDWLVVLMEQYVQDIFKYIYLTVKQQCRFVLKLTELIHKGPLSVPQT